MFKKIIAIILCIITVLSLTSCGVTSVKNIKPMTLSENSFSDFDTALINYILEAKGDETDIVLSPLSFKSAIALSIEGADKNTEKELLSAMGFDSKEDVYAWYDNIQVYSEKFNNDLSLDIKRFEELEFSGKLPDRKFHITNSIWHNKDGISVLKDTFVNYSALEEPSISEVL